MISVTLTGEEAIDAELDRLAPDVLAAIAAKSAALAARLRDRAETKLNGGLLHSRSGALAASIGVDGPVTSAGRVVTTLYSGGDLKYAAIQEYGGVTPPHDILPSRAETLAFIASGEQVFAAHVHHPGSRVPERSYLRSSLTEMAADIEAGMTAVLADAICARSE